MSSMLRKIEKRGQWVATFRNAEGKLRMVIPAPPVRQHKPKVERVRKPSALARAFADLAAHKEDQRAQKAAAALAQERAQKPGAWAKVRGALGRMFRRKV